MRTETSRIWTEVDYEKDGKQVGHLHAPISTNTSAYGTVLIPMTVAKNGRGPTLLAIGGVHGDEYEGPLVLTRLARAIDPGRMNGRVIIIPALNLPAVLSGTRCSPLDGLNLNRAFPGERNGSLTSMIAHYVHAVLFPLCDVVMDLHSGGRTLDYLPTTGMHYLADPERRERTTALVKAFGAPLALVSRDLDEAGYLDYSAERLGKIAFGTELGGAGDLSRQAVKIGEAGCANVLRHLGILAGPENPEPTLHPATRMIEIPDLGYYSLAPDDGVFECFHALGEQIEPGMPIGQLHRFNRPDRDPEPVMAARSGMLICRRPQAKVEQGDCVAVLAKDMDEETTD